MNRIRSDDLSHEERELYSQDHYLIVKLLIFHDNVN